MPQNSKVIPLLKKIPPNETKSYRAINILSIVGKIIDKIIAEQLLTYLTENHLIPHEHHGGV